MRLLRSVGAVASLLAAAGVWSLGGSSAAPTDHGRNLWAGKWETSTGSVSWRLLSESEIQTAKKTPDAKELFNKLPCKNGPQLYRGGYAAGADRGKIMGCGTPTNMRGRWLSNVGGNFQNGSYAIHISSSSPLRFTGTFRQDDGVTGKYEGTWLRHFEDGCCTDEEETLPDALVPIESVSNGCGGGKASTDIKRGDTSVYLDSNDPRGKRYEVNFREACNLHDAGYSGAKVRDVVNGGKVVDFLDWSRLEVDDKFLADMLTLCRRKISALAPSALADCRGTGGKTSLGARSRYNFVRDAGGLFYQERPNFRGLWSSERDPNAPAWALVQAGRTVKASWRGGASRPTLRGQFRGTLITRDDDSIVMGFATIAESGKTVKAKMRLLIGVDDLDRFTMTGPGGPLTLVRAGG